METEQESEAPQRPRSRTEFEIAIICALPLEFHAVDAVFDHDWEDEKVYSKAPGDDNAYTVGRICGYNVVLALMLKMGSTALAGVAASFRASFPYIKLGLVPDQFVRKDTLRDSFGHPNDGIKAFLGKLAGARSRTLLRNNASHFLTRLLGEPEFKISRFPGSDKDQVYHATYRHKYHDPAKCTVCAKCQSTEASVCEDSKTTDCTTLECSGNDLVRQGRTNRNHLTETDFAVHFGLMASGNSVMKSGYHRDKIATKEGVIGFEMEGAGSVCDYADSHKNKEWQSYAAVTAAACTKAFLKQWRPTAQLPETLSTQLVQYQPKYEAALDSSLVPKEAWQVAVADSKSLPPLLARISIYDQTKVHRCWKDLRLNGTTDWILGHPVLLEWLNCSNTSSLWLSGSVGSGKTIICSRVIDHLIYLSTITGNPVLYYYCNSSEGGGDRPKFLVESFIRQLLEYMLKIQKTCPEEVLKKVKNFYEPKGPDSDFEDVCDIFSVLFSAVSKAWYVIDGFDELHSKEMPKFLSFLRKTVESGSAQKLLVSSREDIGPNIRMSLQHRIQLSKSDTKQDILYYIDSEIQRKMDTEKVLTENPDVIEKMRSQLGSKAQGMFLWVRLQLENLWLDCDTDANILASLDNLPGDLNTTYRRCLERIAFPGLILSRKVFRWIICATRPLTLKELREAVGFDLLDHHWDSAKLPNQAKIISSGSNLITLDETDLCVHLIHPSVKQYLCSSISFLLVGFEPIEDKQADLECGEECVNYLSFSNFSQQLQKQSEATVSTYVPNPESILTSMPFHKVAGKFTGVFSGQSKVEAVRITAPSPHQSRTHPTEEVKYAFLNYARQNWPIHTRHLKKSFNESEPGRWFKFRDLTITPDIVWKLQPWNTTTSSMVSHLYAGLSYASRTGHVALLRTILLHGTKYRMKEFIDIPFVEDGLPALHAASRQGFVDVVEMLLEVCNPTALDTALLNALHHAVDKTHIGVASKLASHKKVSPLECPGRTELPIAMAIRCRTDSMFFCLLSHCEKQLKRSILVSPLLVLAAEYDQLAILERLYSFQRITMETTQLAIEAASRNGHGVVMHLLLQHLPDSKSRQECIRLMLQNAIQCDREAIVEQLLKRTDMDVNHYTDNGITPLMMALVNEHQGCLNLLLGYHRLNVNQRSRTSSVGTALIHAVSHGEVARFKCLLKRPDIDVNAYSSENHTALSLAIDNGNTDIVEVLLADARVDVNQDIGYGYTPLLLAVSIYRNPYISVRHRYIIKLLIRHGRVDVNKAGTRRPCHTPLMVASRDDLGEVAKLLLQHIETIVNLTNENDYTALMLAVLNNSKTALKEFLRIRGWSSGFADIVDMSVKGPNGLTALETAAQLPDLEIWHILKEEEDIQRSSASEPHWRRF